MEIKKNKNALEIVNDAIKSGTVNNLDSGELLLALQNIKRSLNNADVSKDFMKANTQLK